MLRSNKWVYRCNVLIWPPSILDFTVCVSLQYTTRPLLSRYITVTAHISNMVGLTENGKPEPSLQPPLGVIFHPEDLLVWLNSENSRCVLGSSSCRPAEKQQVNALHFSQFGKSPNKPLTTSKPHLSHFQTAVVAHVRARPLLLRPVLILLASTPCVCKASLSHGVGFYTLPELILYVAGWDLVGQAWVWMHDRAAVAGDQGKQVRFEMICCRQFCEVWIYNIWIWRFHKSNSTNQLWWQPDDLSDILVVMVQPFF